MLKCTVGKYLKYLSRQQHSRKIDSQSCHMRPVSHQGGKEDGSLRGSGVRTRASHVIQNILAGSAFAFLTLNTVFQIGSENDLPLPQQDCLKNINLEVLEHSLACTRGGGRFSSLFINLDEGLVDCLGKEHLFVICKKGTRRISLVSEIRKHQTFLLNGFERFKTPRY